MSTQTHKLTNSQSKQLSKVFQNIKHWIAEGDVSFSGSLQRLKKIIPDPWELIVEQLGEVSIPKISIYFEAKNYFAFNARYRGRVTIAETDENFRNWFLKKKEIPEEETKIKFWNFNRGFSLREVSAEMTNSHSSSITLGQIWGLLKRQPNGEDGVLQTKESGSLFLVRDGEETFEGTLRVIIVTWKQSGWKIMARDIGDSGYYYEKLRIFSGATSEQIDHPYD